VTVRRRRRRLGQCPRDADGAADPLDPVANSGTLAKLIPNAQLVLYADAAHAFLFQEPDFAARVDSFLH